MLQRQVARTRALQAGRSNDVNTLPDPRTYAAAMGLLGTAPDEMGFSVMHPDLAGIKQVAEPAYALGTAAAMAPIMQALAQSRIARQALMSGGKAIAPKIEQYMAKQGMMPGMMEQGSKTLPKFEVLKRDASDIFGAGAERVRYTDPTSGGSIDVLVRPKTGASVMSLEVPESFRGQGIGESLQSQVLQDFPQMQGQVSSKAAAKTAYRLGRRPPNQPNAKLEDVFNLMDENSSVNMVSPQMQRSFNKAEPFIYPRQAALDTAQRNAALPVEQGGLGLAAGNTPMERAGAMGFNPNAPMYHATDVDFGAFQPSPRGKLGAGVYVSPSSRYAEKYAGDNARVLPLMSRGQLASDDVAQNISEGVRQEMLAQNPNFSVPEWKQRTTQALTEAGYAGRDMEGLESVITNPSNLRSRYAAFDPFQRNSPDILAGALPLTALSDEDMRNQMLKFARRR